jgi:transketolase
MPSVDKNDSVAQLAINTIRTLSMDAVQKANSGHPGTPMALAPVTYQLWQHNLSYDPSQPLWPGRDRFVLSCGHASMLLYSILHLTGVRKVAKHENRVEDGLAITLEDIKNFRQLESSTPGHPEFGYAAGIETTTGPLGQGVGTSVGLAMAAKWLAARYNRPGFDLFDSRVYVLCSDGDLMEGISSEAASLAGHLQLDNLLWIYDDNNITIEGETELAFSEQVAKRFEGYGWHTLRVDDANDLGAIQRAIDAAKQTTDRPTIICLKSIIGYGAPNKANTHAAHGAPLGEDEIKLAKQFYGWAENEKFLVPDEVREHFSAGIGARGRHEREAWEKKLAEYAKAYPQEAAELRSMWSGKLPGGWDQGIPSFATDAKGLASRVSSGKVLNGLAKHIPWIIGGSADLAPSTMTLLDGEKDFEAGNYSGRNLRFGIREHGMAAICNGLSLAGLRPFGATFFVFTDYLRPAMRLSAIMHRPAIYVLTHDSIGLGEDGPTHQPIEHLAACRAMIGLDVVRPGDANEVAECYRTVIQRLEHPAAMVLSRQNLPTLDRAKFAPASGAARGAYILAEAQGGRPDALLMATGSEVEIAVKAWEKLTAEGLKIRLISMPCFEWFDEQDEAYRRSVLPSEVKARVAIEAGVRQCWDRYLGEHGRFVGMHTYGASAPYAHLYQHFGITPERVIEEVKAAVATKIA